MKLLSGKMRLYASIARKIWIFFRIFLALEFDFPLSEIHSAISWAYEKNEDSNLIFYSFPFFASISHLSSTDKAPSEATFRGTEFLSYDLGQTGGEPIVSSQDAISLYFRTRQPNGLLFFTGKLKISVLLLHSMAHNIFD